MQSQGPPPAASTGHQFTVEMVVPVYNEQEDLRSSVLRLRAYLDEHFPFPTLVTIADNASTDRTWEIAQSLAGSVAGVQAVHLAEKGRGRALRQAWMASTCAVVAYTDVDLSTDLEAFLPLVAPLLSGHSDIAIGTRLAPGSRVVRGPKREMISRSYNLIVKTVLRNKFSDAQCGFKALRSDVARALVPLVEDNEWFFDTELLVLAERNGLRIHEVPVDWVDDPDSRVDLKKTATDDLKGVWRLLRGLGQGQGRLQVATGSGPGSADQTGVEDNNEVLARQLIHFAGIGVVSTVVWLALWLALRPVLGSFGANALALVICTAANTAANQRITFAHRDGDGLRTNLAGGLMVLGTSLALSTLALILVRWLSGSSPVLVDLIALVAANAAASMLRFIILRGVIYHRHNSAAAATPAKGSREDLDSAIAPASTSTRSHTGRLIP